MLHWYAIYTKPNRERQVDSLLRGEGVETYLPTIRRKQRRRDRPERVVYFPSYLFARVDFAQTPRSTVAWMPGVRRIVSSGDQPTVVADEIVNLVRRRLEGIEQIGSVHFEPGSPVRIVSGPLRDLDAIFDQSLPARDRVRVLLHVMGRMTPVEIDSSDIVST